MYSDDSVSHLPVALAIFCVNVTERPVFLDSFSKWSCKFIRTYLVWLQIVLPRKTVDQLDSF